MKYVPPAIVFVYDPVVRSKTMIRIPTKPEVSSRAFRSRRLIEVVLVLLAALSWLPGAAPGICGQDTPAIPTATFPDGRSFRLEVARMPEERARGYMFREKVGPEEGMLFPFATDDFHPFWMKNCLVPLDLIWLSETLTVVHLEARVPPCTHDPCPSYLPMRKARFVLEVKGGMAEKAGLRVGDPVRLEGVDSSVRNPR
jgi:uncharacterized membrane protein (UPF0127 family)